jgi:imidazolonepropionase-like amidohydrolase
LADILLVDSNPLKDLSVLVGPGHFSMIMKDGAMYRDPRDARRSDHRKVAAE